MPPCWSMPTSRCARRSRQHRLGLLWAAVKLALFRLGWLLVWTCACGGKAAGTGSPESPMDASDELAAKVPSHDDDAALSDAHTIITDANESPTIDATLADARVAVRPDGAATSEDASETGPVSTLCNGSPVDLASDSANCGA